MGKVKDHVVGKLFLGFLVFAFSMILFGKKDAYADEVEFEYKITTESDDWFNYTVKQKVEMLRIDEETLENMTDEQVVRAVIDYPYILDIYVYGDLETGLRTVSKYCDALRELQTRENWKEVFCEYATIFANEYRENPEILTPGRYIVLAELIYYYSGNAEFFAEYLLDPEQIEEENSEITENNMVVTDDNTAIETETEEAYTLNTETSVPTTPEGSTVQYSTPSERHSSAYHAQKDEEFAADYGVTLIQNGSCRYNCHSYAWHSTSPSNIYWINDPSVYMTDGSYSDVYNGSISTSTYYCNASVGDKVYYASNTHTAIFVDNPANGAPLASADVESKWGQLGVFKHDVNNVPSGYDYSSVSIWH